MLVLSRKTSESIVIEDDIEIMVVEIRGDKVRLGVNAPRAVSVHRREIYDRIRSNCDEAQDDIRSDTSLHGGSVLRDEPETEADASSTGITGEAG